MSTPDKVALVTGAGSGIGRASALALAKEGYAIALAGRRQEAFDETASRASNVPTLAVLTDFGDPVAVNAVVETIRSVCGRLEVPFNYA